MSNQAIEQFVQEAVDDFYRELEWDCVGLYRISDAVVKEFPNADLATVRRISMLVVQRLLSAPRIHAGRPSASIAGAFDAWPLTAQQSLERIQREWQALGDMPNIDEICWFGVS